jgi:S-adenosylmethionine-diacylglycerol 3-amino-3-carboxypropyl transferase
VNLPAPADSPAADSPAADALRSVVQERPVFSRIVYSQCWEDPEIAADGLALAPTDDLLCLSSAGDNVMALALRRPRSITAIDFSAAQNALLELKLAALRRLPWYDYAAFLGARPAFDRVAVYRDRLRGELRDEGRAYFDGQEAELARGIIHAGRFQRYLATFRAAILPLIHRRDVVEEMMAIEDRDARAAYYDRVWDNRRWRALFTVFFGRAVMARLGRDPAFFRYVERPDVGRTFLARARRALVETSPLHNHFLQYALLGRYPDLERGPVYLRESSFAALRAATDGIRIVRSDLESFLATLAPGALSALYLSDLFEWVAPDHHAAMLRQIVRATRPGGRMVYWNLLVPRSRPEELAAQIAVHAEEARALHDRDLAFVYGSFHVESVL